MAPVGQYVFAEMLGISEHFTAGSHEWLPYSDFPTFPKQSAKHQFVFPYTNTPCDRRSQGVFVIWTVTW